VERHLGDAMTLSNRTQYDLNGRDEIVTLEPNITHHSPTVDPKMLV